tara:strand:- start:525 stop:1358 length:834 start_codon:yes stop_codon:yes gene_type:complete
LSQKYFEIGFSKVKTAMERDLFLYSICLWNNNERDKAIRILDTNQFTSLAFNQNRIEYFDNITDELISVTKTKNSLFLKHKIDKLNNSKLFKQLDDIAIREREIRKQYLSIVNSSVEFQDSNMLELITDSMSIISHENFIILDSIFNEYGYLGGTIWPTRVPLSTIMMHSSVEWVEKNKAFLKKELKKGHLLPVDYASVIDRKLYREKGMKYSFYNMWGDINIETVTPEVYFKRANAIGLSPYFDYSTDRIPGFGRMPDKAVFYEKYYEKKRSDNRR